MKPYVIVTDDNEDDLSLVKEAFQHCQSPAQVETVCSGQALLSWLNDKACLPSLILLDVNMPVLNGFDVLEELKKVKHFKCIPVIMFTTSSNPAEIKYSYEHGANSYLIKPANFGELVKAIDTLSHYWPDLSQLPSKFQHLNINLDFKDPY